MTTATPFITSDTIWRPGPAELDRSRILAFASWAECPSLAELNARADSDPQWFWGCVADWLGLDWITAPESAADQLSQPHKTRWFPGGQFNITDNAVNRWIRAGRGNDAALLWEDEDGTRGQWSFNELNNEI